MLKNILENIVSTGADSVQMRTGHLPYLLQKGASVALRERPMSDDEMCTIVEHLLDGQAAQSFAADNKVDGHYQAGALGVFDYRVRQTGVDDIAVAIRRQTAVAGDGKMKLSRIALTQKESIPSVSKRHPAAKQTVKTPQKPKGSVHLPPIGERTLIGILKAVLTHQISDLVLSAGKPARVRIGGEYVPIPWAIYEASDILGVLEPVLTPGRRATLNESGSLDVAFELTDDQGVVRRFRVNVFNHLTGLAAAWRPIWDQIPQLDELMLPEAILELAELPYGLIIVTGPTGSGKSTTLSALIEHINARSKKHIITLEDPIEYRFRDRESVVHQREVGVHVNSFAVGLRAALRESPDVILVGEMRDLDTIQAALTAAETGHLVLSTLHSGTSAQAIDRIIDVFPEHQQQQVRAQLADSLQAIVAQRLLPTVDGDSRVPAVELVRVNYAVSNTIREQRTHQLNNQIQSGSKTGMIPFDVSLARLVNLEHVAYDVAVRCARDTSHFKSLVKSKPG
ncbi:MAG: PilT/PilU family type 4a pilus ATPase [Myxococcota bacterium]|nr:PilT/PilU family type 4a pilus ATPase [Myxococcota bacterium]